MAELYKDKVLVFRLRESSFQFLPPAHHDMDVKSFLAGDGDYWGNAIRFLRCNKERGLTKSMKLRIAVEVRYFDIEDEMDSVPQRFPVVTASDEVVRSILRNEAVLVQLPFQPELLLQWLTAAILVVFQFEFEMSAFYNIPVPADFKAHLEQEDGKLRSARRNIRALLDHQEKMRKSEIFPDDLKDFEGALTDLNDCFRQFEESVRHFDFLKGMCWNNWKVGRKHFQLMKPAVPELYNLKFWIDPSRGSNGIGHYKTASPTEEEIENFLLGIFPGKSLDRLDFGDLQQDSDFVKSMHKLQEVNSLEGDGPIGRALVKINRQDVFHKVTSCIALLTDISPLEFIDIGKSSEKKNFDLKEMVRNIMYRFFPLKGLDDESETENSNAMLIPVNIERTWEATDIAHDDKQNEQATSEPLEKLGKRILVEQQATEGSDEGGLEPRVKKLKLEFGNEEIKADETSNGKTGSHAKELEMDRGIDSEEPQPKKSKIEANGVHVANGNGYGSEHRSSIEDDSLEGESVKSTSTDSHGTEKMDVMDSTGPQLTEKNEGTSSISLRFPLDAPGMYMNYARQFETSLKEIVMDCIDAHVRMQYCDLDETLRDWHVVQYLLPCFVASYLEICSLAPPKADRAVMMWFGSFIHELINVYKQKGIRRSSCQSIKSDVASTPQLKDFADKHDNKALLNFFEQVTGDFNEKFIGTRTKVGPMLKHFPDLELLYSNVPSSSQSIYWMWMMWDLFGAIKCAISAANQCTPLVVEV